MAKQVSGTAGWAKTTVNVDNGCEHDCLYCYAHAGSARFKTLLEGGWVCRKEREGAATRGFGKRNGTVMFPSTHDTTESTTLKYIGRNRLKRSSALKFQRSRGWMSKMKRTEALEVLESRLRALESRQCFYYRYDTERKIKALQVALTDMKAALK
tara:strand:+ start:446 stop:910 length:465 start_codon:yes stop_codon:yes gene_type:complete